MRLVDYEEFVDLSKMCSIKIGGKAKKVYFPKSIEEVQYLINSSADKDKKIFPIGAGSNTVFSDGLLDQIFISTKKLKKVKIKKSERFFFIEAEAGVSFYTLITIVKKFNLKGFENLAGIPATVGGATVMNAGAFGTEFSQLIEEVLWIDRNGNIVRSKKNQLNFSYRKSPFQKNGFVFSVVLKLEISKDDINKKIRNIMEERIKKQPLNYPTSGSTFKNPEIKPAGYLLEKAGMKGYRIGNVAFSDKHANFLINMGNGRFKDLKNLIEIAERRVGELYQIKLEKEIEIVE